MTAHVSSKKPLVIIVGPTAIGKTRLAILLARRIGGEIISADSMQVYKGMRILNQAPGPSERNRARHHLIEILEPTKEYSVASFIKRARPLIGKIMARRHVPIIVGGSGLYIKGLVDGLFPSPRADLRFRAKTQSFIKRYGSPKLHAKLNDIDPDAAEKIHENDARRIIRALEVHHSTGRTMTELKNSTKGLAAAYSVKIFGLTAPREEIYRRIDDRADEMFESRAVAQVKRLRPRRLSKTAAAVLGLKEISGYLDGEYSAAEAKELLKMNTRRFAKRQLTWFRPDRRIEWFDVTRSGEAEIVRKIWKELS